MTSESTLKSLLFRALRDAKGRREASSQAPGWKRTSRSRKKTCDMGLVTVSEGWEEEGVAGSSDSWVPW